MVKTFILQTSNMETKIEGSVQHQLDSESVQIPDYLSQAVTLVTRVSQTLSKAEAEKTELLNKVRMLDLQLKTANIELQESQKTANILEGKLANKKKLVENLNEQVKKQNDDINLLKTENSKLINLKNEVGSLKEKLEKSNNEKNSFEQQMRKKEDEAAACKKETKDLKDKLAQKNKRIRKLRSSYRDVVQRQQEIHNSGQKNLDYHSNSISYDSLSEVSEDEEVDCNNATDENRTMPCLSPNATLQVQDSSGHATKRQKTKQHSKYAYYRE